MTHMEYLSMIDLINPSIGAAIITALVSVCCTTALIITMLICKSAVHKASKIIIKGLSESNVPPDGLSTSREHTRVLGRLRDTLRSAVKKGVKVNGILYNNVPVDPFYTSAIARVWNQPCNPNDPGIIGFCLEGRTYIQLRPGKEDDAINALTDAIESGKDLCDLTNLLSSRPLPDDWV